MGKEPFEMDRQCRSGQEFRCDWCGEQIRPGDKLVVQVYRSGNHWAICEECAVFGDPNSSVLDGDLERMGLL